MLRRPAGLPMNDPNTTRSVKTAALTVGGASAVAATVAFLSNVLAARALGPELRGNIAFVLQFAYLLAPLIILGSDRAILRGNRTATREPPYFVPSRLYLISVVLGLTAASYFVFCDWRVLIGPTAGTFAWFNLRRSQVLSEGKYRRFALPFASFQLSTLLIHGSLFIFGITEWGIWSLAYAAPFLILALWDSAIPRGHAFASQANFPFLANSVGQILILRGERVLLPLMTSPTQLGYYVVVATATEPLFWITKVVTDHRVGAERQPTNTPDRLKDLSRDIALSAPFAITIGVVTWFLLVPIFGEAFEPARSLIPPLTLASVLLFTYRQVGTWLLASQSPALAGGFELRMAIVAAALYGIFILAWGTAGAAWASATVYGIATVYGLGLCTVSQTKDD